MTYPNERQVEYWTSRAIEEYFVNEGYSVIVLANTPHVEQHLPFDHLFAGQGVKVFGLQYKRLYASPDRWRLKQAQHQRMRSHRWIFYALSELRHIRQCRNALHWLQLASASFAYRAALRPEHLGNSGGGIPYARWGGFVRQLLACSFGWQIGSAGEVTTVLGIARDLADALVDVYFLAPRQSLVVRVSPLVADVGGEAREEYDLGME